MTQKFGEYRSLVQKQPSITVFRQICSLLETDTEREDFEEIISYVTDSVRDWSYATRHAPKHWIQRFVDGTFPHVMLAPVGAMTLIPVFLTDEFTAMPFDEFATPSEQIKERMATLLGWIGSIPTDDSRLCVELLDLSTVQIDKELEYGLGLYDLEDEFSKFFASPWLRETRALNLSNGMFDDDDIGNHDSYLYADQKRSVYPPVSLNILSNSPCANGLETLMLAGTNVSGRAKKGAFPNLRVLDLSYGINDHWRDDRAIQQFINGQAPGLRELHLRTSYFLDFACGGPYEVDEDDEDEEESYLNHDYCVSSDSTEYALFSTGVIRAIVSAKHTPEIGFIDFGAEVDRAREICSSMDEEKLEVLSGGSTYRLRDQFIEDDPHIVVQWR